MKRRDFSKNIVLGAGMFTLAACSISKPLAQNSSNMKIKPNRLHKGDTVGLIAPASSFDKEGLEKAKTNIRNLGFEVKISSNLYKKWGYLAGSDQERVDDIHEMFLDKEVKAIWCIRGGYGVTRILHMIDYNIIKQNPKIIIGYSDITALIHAIYIHTGLVGFHGPVAKSSPDPYNTEYINKILINPMPTVHISYHKTGDQPIYNPYVITPGTATGELSGGNLSLLSALAGTDNHWDAKDKLVFIEDIEERPYRIDRMLTQLLQGANLADAKAIILGVFRGCEKEEGDEDSLSLKQVLQDRLGQLGIPVFYGFSFGHIHKICTLPVGIEAKFDTSIPEITLLEPAVR